MTNSIIIQHQDGTSYDLDQCDFKVVSYDPPNINYNHSFTNISDDLPTLTQTTIQQMTIPLVVELQAHDYYDYELQVLKLRQIFKSNQYFYVINSRIPFLRYKVVAQSFDIKRLSNFYYSQNITINLIAIDGCAETLGVTSDSTFISDLNSWGIGENIPTKQISYSFSCNNFTFYNLGLLDLKAESRPVLMKINATADNLKITNKTTNQIWQLNTHIDSNNELDLNGVKPVYNGQNLYANTNHAYLDFVSGANEIEIDNASNLKITFETRFYF